MPLVAFVNSAYVCAGLGVCVVCGVGACDMNAGAWSGASYIVRCVVSRKTHIYIYIYLESVSGSII